MSKAKPDPPKLSQVGDNVGPMPDQADSLTQAAKQRLDDLAQAQDPHKACNKHINNLIKERDRLTKQVGQLEADYRRDIKEIHDRYTDLNSRYTQLNIAHSHATKDAQLASVMIVVGSPLLSIGGALSNAWKWILLAAGGATALWGLYLQHHLARRSTQL